MGERWDRDRFMFERARDKSRLDDDRSYMRGGRGRDHSEERFDRRTNRSFDEDDMVRDRRYYGDEPRYMPQREREAPPPFARRGVLEKERERDYFPRRESPPRRPGFLRRQSSLDTFDRRPSRLFREREEYPPPARREDVRRGSRDESRAPPYTPIPLPKTRGLPPPRRFADQGFYDDIKVAEPDFYGDDDFRPYPERVREKEYTKSRSRRAVSRGRSRDSHSTRTRSVRSSSYSSSSSRSSSSSGGTTVRSEYPKKGKTRIPAKLVSKRALIDLGYPFFEEGHTIIVQKALGQDNIDELLKVSEDYKKVEAEIAAARKPAPAILPPPAQAKPQPPPQQLPPPQQAPPAPKAPTQAPPPQAPPQQAPPPQQPPPQQAPPPQAPPVQAPPHQAPPVQKVPAPIPVPAPAPQPPIQMQPVHMPPPPGPIYMNPPGPAPVEIVDETIIRDVSPSRSTTTMSSWDTSSFQDTSSFHHHHHHQGELIHKSRSRSRGGRREIRAEIRALERELAHRPRGRSSTGGELVHAERLPDGQVVIIEDKLEKVVEHRKPPRIEKDKKGPPPALMRAMLATLT
ncbi:hypothetical protein CEP51_008360 [Fusarium floridanum]|uniref:DUF8035 domain-containing protein n=1 Tax=Fusarium floridanum TaxID=1325733 RepID=A0A428RL44_9HYPO|nr:hypothetical protein CEP51_008360 [Fusarium floridanum]